MSARRTIINIEKPTTQTVPAVCALLAWKKRGIDPLPEFVELGSGEDRCMLILSNKKDCYYVTTARDCSCPAHNWHPNQPCKHQRRYFPEEKQQRTNTKPAAIKQPNTGSWHGANGPIAPEETKAAKVSSIPLVDCLGEPTPGELAYWSIQADREMWPAEA